MRERKKGWWGGGVGGENEPLLVCKQAVLVDQSNQTIEEKYELMIFRQESRLWA